MTPRLTIITPSYNQAEFIERTIRSVLDQGYENLEYFVVDGGSTDGSPSIIKRYEDRLAWWVSEPDRGQTHAINKGIRRATGNVIAFINSDDYYLPGAFEAVASALEPSPAAWIAGAVRCETPTGQELELWRPQKPWGGRHWWLLSTWGVPQAATFWRRECFERYGVFREDMHYVFDTEYGLRLAIAGELPARIDRPLAVRVIYEGAKSWDRSPGSPFYREQERLIELFSSQLTRSESTRLHIAQKLERVGLYRLTSALSHAWRRSGLPPLRSG
jgi:glycosyltransferase involved in cell wall biosynthesis